MQSSRSSYPAIRLTAKAQIILVGNSLEMRQHHQPNTSWVLEHCTKKHVVSCGSLLDCMAHVQPKTHYSICFAACNLGTYQASHESIQSRCDRQCGEVCSRSSFSGIGRQKVMCWHVLCYVCCKQILVFPSDIRESMGIYIFEGLPVDSRQGHEIHCWRHCTGATFHKSALSWLGPA